LKPFEIVETERADDRLIVLSLRGYLDAHTVNDFESFMDQAIERGQVHYLVDISGLNYMSSAGIGAIMSLTQRLRRADGDLVLLQPSEKVFRILEKLGFTKIFRLAYSREEGEKLLNP
jgi:anti-sigma B factor antagonist